MEAQFASAVALREVELIGQTQKLGQHTSTRDFQTSKVKQKQKPNNRNTKNATSPSLQ